MITSSLVAFLAILTCTYATPACTAEERIQIAKMIPAAYAQPDATATSEAFQDIPFGVPDINGPCATELWPTGGDLLSTGTDGNGVVNFGIATRQLFSSVTGEYEDFNTNGTTVIYSNVTMGLSSVIPIPVTFPSQTYLDFTNECRIDAVRMYVDVDVGVDVDVDVDVDVGVGVGVGVGVDIGKETDPYNLYPFTIANVSIFLRA